MSIHRKLARAYCTLWTERGRKWAENTDRPDQLRRVAEVAENIDRYVNAYDLFEGICLAESGDEPSLAEMQELAETLTGSPTKIPTWNQLRLYLEGVAECYPNVALES